MRDYSIADRAKRTGLAVRTIRFYSDKGVLPPIGSRGEQITVKLANLQTRLRR